MIVNCTGIWSDRVNAAFNIHSPFRHVLSKGVYLGLPRHAEHHNPLFFDLGEHGDVVTHVPWGPIALWGPTETAVETVEESCIPKQSDIDFLLEHYARRYQQPMTQQDIISVRCGVRPLVVQKDYRCDSTYPLDLSRRQEIVRDENRPWISCYGGKMTDCMAMAQKVEKIIFKSIPSSGKKSTATFPKDPLFESIAFPGISQPMPSPKWCLENTMCCTLEDYLRRRTNIAQWVDRAGLGKADCYAETVKKIALELALGEHSLAEKWYDAYTRKVAEEFDSLMKKEANE